MAKNEKKNSGDMAPLAIVDRGDAAGKTGFSGPPPDADAREYRLFASLDLGRRGYIYRDEFETALREVGLSSDDFRLRESIAALEAHGPESRISYEAFCQIIRPNVLLIERALQGNMIVHDFGDFSQQLAALYEDTEKNRSGALADYIPQLARVDPEQYGVAVCTIDGQRFAIGDSRVDYCVQSCCKTINYCMALEEHGEDYVHSHVGREPSGRSFNEMVLNDAGKPHNPLINAGAIMCTSLIKPGLDAADRFDYIMGVWTELCGGEKPRFNNAVYLSERKTAARNFALAYMMTERKAFPEGTDLVETLELYFQCCSIELNAEMMAMVAATLANGGVCPTRNKRVFNSKTVQNCLSLMYSCGMYDFSGEFAFTIGMPAKSGVGGGLLIVIPNVMGICTWSPRLDAMGNSVRGVEFCKRLIKTFNFHNYDNLTGLSEKTDPRVNRIRAVAEKSSELLWAASKGDLGAMQHLVMKGVDLNSSDYDGRTPLHLAAAENQLEVVKFLVDHGVDLNPRDRWGGAPLDDAYMHFHSDIIDLLEQGGAVRHHVDEITWLGGADEDDANTTALPGQSAGIGEMIWAASMGSLKAIRFLVARGVDLVEADYDGRTPLHLAAAEGHDDVVQFFIDHGVNLNPRDRWGHTPLEDANRHGHTTIVALLEKHGAER